jgi:TrmH family RNA methyltransferase
MDKMGSQAEIKLFASLRMPKFRQKYGLFLVEGRKGVEEVFHSNLEIDRIMVTPAYTQKFDPPKNAVEISEKELQKISNFDTPPGILAVVHIPQSPIEIPTDSPFTLVLDGISDPGNLGTIIRIADWYGINNVLVSNDSVDVYNAKCISASMGSFVRVSTHYTDLKIALPKFSEVFGAFLDGKSVYDISVPADHGNRALVIGSESHGIRPEIVPFIQQRVTIPKKGKAESLNAGIATAILVDRLLVS